MTSSDGSSAVGGDDRVVEAVTEGYRESGHRCRVVNHGEDTYVRVLGEGRDALVWIRRGGSQSDAGLSRFALECERYGVRERHVLSTVDGDPVATHARSLGMEFSGPAKLAVALRAVDVLVPFETGDDPEPFESETGGSGTDGRAAGGLWSRVAGALLSALALSLALVATGVVP